ncbi:MAG: hypothetical protein A2Z20_11930 [Bdellovibrionales bacterium RBG_16_40_8]|nr:MAG: hypothetical protein A2Z20_11930 [Bdellovibrionales bacterium RBG_16_40_8]
MLFSKKIAAIDVGTRTLKGLQLCKHKGQVCVDKFFFHDMATNNELYPLEIPVYETLKAIIQVNGFQNACITSAPQDNEILTQDLTLPDMPVKDLRSAIFNDIETHLNLSASEISLDYLILKKLNPEGQIQNVIKAYCATRQVTDSQIRSLRAIGLKPRYLESGILARVAMLIFNGYVTENKNYVHIDIGESHISVALISDGKVVISSVLPTGQGAINKLLFDTNGLPYDQAEKIKISYDLAAEETSLNKDDQALIDEIYHQSFYKICRLIDVFKVQLKSDPIYSVQVTGGGSQINNLSKALETYCKLPIEIVNPFKNIEIYIRSKIENNSLALIAPYMSTAVGLALKDIA